MRQSIKPLSKEIKQNFSSAAIVRDVTAPLDEYALAMLNGIDYYSRLEKKCCYLPIIKLGKELKHWGAPKGVCRSKAYELHSKLEALGLTARYRRHRRATYETVLTQAGKDILFTLKYEPWNFSPNESGKDFIPEAPNLDISATLPEEQDYKYKNKTNNTRGCLDLFHYFRSEKTGLLVFSDDTIQNLADNYGFEVVRHAIQALKAAKNPPDNKVGYLIGILKNWKKEDILMKTEEKSKPSNYDNAFSAQERMEKATSYARKELSFRGIHYPVRAPGMSTIEFYDATLAYGQKEAALIAEYLKPVAKPRPIAIDTTPAKPKWGQPYYD